MKVFKKNFAHSEMAFTSDACFYPHCLAAFPHISSKLLLGTGTPSPAAL